MPTQPLDNGHSLTIVDQSVSVSDPVGDSLWPLQPTTVPGETLPSWLRAMARVYRIDTKTMVHLLGLPIRRQNYRTMHNAAQHFAQNVAKTSGCRIEEFERMAAGWQPPALQRFTAETTATIVAAVNGSSYCPLCLKDNGGRWVTDWLNPLYTYCPEHAVRLEKLCPNCQSRPFHGIDWLWDNRDGWQCCKTNAATPDGDVVKTRVCGFDLRQAEPSGDTTAERLFAQDHLKWVLDSVLVGHQEIPMCGTILKPREACTLFLGLIAHGKGIKASKSGYQATPRTPEAVAEASRILCADTQREAQLELAALGRKASLSLTVPTLAGNWLQLNNDITSPAKTVPGQATRDVERSPWEAWNQEAMLPRIHFHERNLPAMVWPSALEGIHSKHLYTTKIAISVALVRAIHQTDWSRAASRLGFQYKDHSKISRNVRKNDLVGEVNRQVYRIKPFLEALNDDELLIDYGRRRKELLNPEPLMKTLTEYWHDNVGTSADLPALTCRFWALYTGGDIRFVPALYSRIAMSQTETAMWMSDQDYRRTVHYHFNLLAKEILHNRGMNEPVIWRPQIRNDDHAE